MVRLIITYTRAEPTLHLACCVFQGQSPLSLPSLNEESPTKAHGEGTAQDTVSGGSCMQQVCKQSTRTIVSVQVLKLCGLLWWDCVQRVYRMSYLG